MVIINGKQNGFANNLSKKTTISVASMNLVELIVYYFHWYAKASAMQ